MDSTTFGITLILQGSRQIGNRRTSVPKACLECIEWFGFAAKMVLWKTFGMFQRSIPISGYFTSHLTVSFSAPSPDDKSSG
jgi:hypothetical protein